MNNTCIPFFGFKRAHKFRARYDSVPPTPAEFVNFKTLPCFVIEALTKHVYRNDVCVRCGAVVNPK